MIRLKVVSGSMAGEERIVSNVFTPDDLLVQLLARGLEWEIAYESATEEEHFAWFKSDISHRIIRALQCGHPVVFRDTIYSVKNRNDPFECAKLSADILATIVDSDYTVFIKQDGVAGLIIGSEKIPV